MMHFFCRIHDIERQQFVFFVVIDGCTQSATKLTSGPIGKLLKKLDKYGFIKGRKVVDFTPIEGSDRVKNFDEAINYDMLTAILWVQAIMSGNKQFECMKPFFDLL